MGGLQCVLVFPGQLTFWSFHLYYNQNRSALLCKVMSDNSLLAVNSVNRLSMVIAIADLFQVTYVEFSPSNGIASTSLCAFQKCCRSFVSQ